MSSLYTVRMIRKHVVTKYDAKGRAIAETVTEIPIVFTDLPAATATMYKTKFPDNKVTITEQAYSSDGPRDHAARKKIGGGAFKSAPKHVTAPVSEPTAAKTGDMAAAINAELEEAK